MAKMYNNGKPRKKRAKSSYTTYKQHIRELIKKGYDIDKSEILTKKQFDYKFARFKAVGKKNITRDMAKDLVSYQYQRYTNYVNRWKKKGFAMYDTLSKEEFSEFYENAKKVESLKKRGVAYEIAEADLLFQPEFAKGYAPYKYYSDEGVEYNEDDFDASSISAQEKREIKKIELDIMKGKYDGHKLFEKYVNDKNGYYEDEKGIHVYDNVRKDFEAMIGY